MNVNPIERAAAKADKINAANAKLERQTREHLDTHFQVVHVTNNTNQEA